MLETGLVAPDHGMRRNYLFKPVMDRQTDRQTNRQNVSDASSFLYLVNPLLLYDRRFGDCNLVFTDDDEKKNFALEL